MTERPILFSGPMVRAILEGLKTQTRRVVKPQPNSGPNGRMVDLGGGWGLLDGDLSGEWCCPYGVPGDRLFVREKGWQRPERTPRMMREGADTWGPYYYDADGLTEADHEQFKEWGFKRRPSIHMPRKFCRLILEVTAVRVERLQDISETDAEREGALGPSSVPVPSGQHRSAFRALWDSLNAKRAPWASNPWVWVLEFRGTTDFPIAPH